MSMIRITDESCSKFVEVLASKEPVPGGGGAAALVAAIGVALGNMVGSLTVGKPRYADVQDEVVVLKKKADALQARLIKLVTRDAEVFAPLARAYGLPKDTKEQQEHKAKVMEACLRRCCEVPLEIMECCCEAIDLHERFAVKGAAIAISDVGCGVICCKAALEAASLNVFINTKSMTDRAFAAEINKRANDLLEVYTAKADVIFKTVAARLR
jgi:formiminotetrahydrofolate cyclodeaminase